MADAKPIGVAGTGPLARAILEMLAEKGAATREYVTQPVPRDLERLGALVLADDDDARNVDVALHIRENHPQLPLIVRVFEPALEEYLERSAPDIAVLSMSGVAVPVLIELAGAGPISTTGPMAWLVDFARKLDLLLLGMLAFVTSLAAAATLFFKGAMKLTLVDAFYYVVTTMTTTGYGDISPKDETTSVKLAAAALMVLGTSAFALLFALVSDWVFARRLDVVLGRVPTRWANHVVLVGAGHMSARVAAVLRERGEHALVVERNAENPLIAVLRAQGHQVLVADATKEQTLRLAGADRARSLLVLTDQDAHNLHIALIASRISSAAKVWARIDSPPLSRHVTAHSTIRASSPLLMAARAFVDEAIARVGR